MSPRQDPITWKQIGFGYVVLLCLGLGLASALLDRSSVLASDPVRSIVGVALFAAGYGLCSLLERPVSRGSAWLAPTADGQLRMKRWAVGAMWLLSVLLCIASVGVTRVVHPW